MSNLNIQTDPSNMSKVPAQISIWDGSQWLEISNQQTINTIHQNVSDTTNADSYTPAKKANLKAQIALLTASEESTVEYAKSVGDDYSNITTAYDALISGTKDLLADMTVTTTFDHTKIDTWFSDLQTAISSYQNSVNSSLVKKMGKTADGHQIWYGSEEPTGMVKGDWWTEVNPNGTTQLMYYDGTEWINKVDTNIKDVAATVAKLPQNYYQPDEPTGTDYNNGDLWYQTETDSNGNISYVIHKWDIADNKWELLVDANANQNYVSDSEPASPSEGDFWMDGTTLKQYQKGAWVTIPTEGPQGVAGTSTYIHVAYATSSDGKTGFSTTSFDGAVYIGVLTDSNKDDSTTYSDYTWSRMKGSDGTDGTDGVQGPKGADGKTTYVHFAYANSSDGETNFSTTYFNNALYIGTLTNETEADSTVYSDYTWSRLMGDTGATGAQGATTYTWIKYATDSSGSNMSDSPTGMTYIGIAYNKTTSTESSTATDYKWSLIKGDQGVQGATGADGKPSYFHIAYANSGDGSVGFTTNPSTSASYNYIGTYSDYTSTNSTNYKSYTWVAMFDSTKKRNFTSTPTTPYTVGDTWTQSGATYYCTTARASGSFTASDWTMQQLTISSLSSDVQSQVNSATGANLFVGTKDFDNLLSWADYGGWTILTDTYKGLSIAQTDQDWNGLSQYIQVSSGETYTFSMYARYTSGTGTSTIYTILNKNPENGYTASNTNPFNVDVSLTSNWQRVSFTFTITSDGWIKPRIERTNKSTNTLQICGMKLEKGSIATPWCLSPMEQLSSSSSYKGVTLNDAGLTATAGATTVAMNSSDGFLIKKSGNTLFDVDTSGNMYINGAITSGGNISGVDFQGDSLTLSGTLGVKGSISAANGNVVINSSGLTMKNGSIYLGTSSGTHTSIDAYGTLQAVNATISGTITTNNLTVTGGDINMNGGVFHVDRNGALYASNANITGTINSNNATITGGSLKVGSNFSVDTGGNLTATNATINIHNSENTFYATLGEVSSDYWGFHLYSSGNQTWIDSNGIHNTDNSGTDTYIKGGKIITDDINTTGLSIYDSSAGPWRVDITESGISYTGEYNGTVEKMGGTLYNFEFNDTRINGFYETIVTEQKMTAMVPNAAGDEWGINVPYLTNGAWTNDFKVVYNATGNGRSQGLHLNGSPLYLNSNDPMIHGSGTIDDVYLQVDSNGNFNIGTNNNTNINLNPSASLGLFGNYIMVKSTGSVHIQSSNSYRVYIGHSGSEMSTDGGSLYNCSTNGWWMRDSNGNMTTVHGTSFVNSSLLSLKTNISKIDPAIALNKINQTNIYDYQYKADVANGSDKHYASFIIDDVNNVSEYTEPNEFLSDDKTGRDDGTQLAYLTAAVQYLAQKVKDLENK